MLETYILLNFVSKYVKIQVLLNFVEETIEDGKIVIKYEPGDSVVCNLASINVAKVNTPEDIKKVVPIAMRLLDNVIDLNFYPIKEAEKTAKKYRSV